MKFLCLLDAKITCKQFIDLNEGIILGIIPHTVSYGHRILLTWKVR